MNILVRVPSEASGGAFSLFEEVPPLADTPLHVHRNEDELFYVLEGEHVFRVGDDEYTVGPGGSSSHRAGCRTRSGASCPARVASSF